MLLFTRSIIFENIANNLLASHCSSVLMDGSTIHTKEKLAVYFQYFQGNKFVKGGEPVNTTLLHVAEPQGVSLNARELKECLVNSFKHVNPCCELDDLIKKFASICTYGASSHIWYKNLV